MVMFLQCLNTSLITVPLPKIAEDLDVSVSESSWLLLSYSLGTCALLLQFAKYSRNNRIRMFFLYGMIIFTMSSCVCGMAKDFVALTVLRLIQGISIAMAAATGPIIVVNKFPDEMKGTALGSMASGTGLAMVLGPSIGGILADIISWHMLFWINIPIALAVLVAAWIVLPKGGEPKEDVDPSVAESVGLFMAIAFGLVLFENITTWDLLTNSLCAMLAVSGLLILILKVLALERGRPLVSPGMLKNKAFILIACSAMMGSMITEGAMYLLPYFMQISWDMDVIVCGTYFSIVSVSTFIAAKAVGYYCDRHSSFIPVISSFICTIVFDIIFIFIEPGWSLALLVMSACMVGISFAVFETAQYLRMIRHTEHKYRDEAATMITVLTYVGASLGLIAYALTFNAAIPEAMGVDIDQLSAVLMTRGFHATGLLGLGLGIGGMLLALTVSRDEDL